jgi:hypothetical protein
MRYYVACLHVAPTVKDERGLWLSCDELRILAAKAGGGAADGGGVRVGGGVESF